MRSDIEALPKSSFDLGGVVTLNESFATGGAIFCQGDIAETLMGVGRLAEIAQQNYITGGFSPSQQQLFPVRCPVEIEDAV